ncbi:MAG: metallophosphoesterase [Chloroflexota bacterium]
MDINVLHLSDLHLSVSNQYDLKLVFQSLVEDLSRLVSDRNVKPNLLVFSGDFIFDGDMGYTDRRSDFNSVKSLVIDELLERFNLTNNDFFFCPGNHDIQRSKINNYYEEGLKVKLINRQEVNQFIDNLDANKEAFSRMENFNKFRDLFPNNNLVSQNDLYSTYIINLASTNIGLACFNSAWRAYGGDKDYGNLVLGERTISKALEDIKNAKFRMGIIHHPFEYFQEFERDDLKRLISSSFNVWLTGHTHNSETNLVQTFNDSEVVMVKAGAMYQSREYYNGYSLVSYSSENNSFTIHLREYSDRGRKFIPAESYATDGVVEYKVTTLSSMPIEVDVNVVSKLKERALEQSKSLSLLSSRKSLLDTFVEPKLSSDPDYKLRSMLDIEKKATMTICVDKLVESEDNYVLIGQKEYGKTTLLQYLYLKFLSPKLLSNAKIPFLVSAKRLPQGKEKIKKLLANFLIENEISINLDQTLIEKKWVILIDDFDFQDKAKIVALAEFINAYPNGKYLITVAQDLSQDLKDEGKYSLPIPYMTFYIQPFGRKEVRSLVENWFGDEMESNLQPGDVTDMVLKKISEFNLPRTPFIVSALLTIIEEKNDFNPINKALLIENIIELLLEKIRPYSTLPEGLDYRNVEDYLSHFAYELSQREDPQLSEEDNSKFLKQYFEKRAFGSSLSLQKFSDLLIDRGILASRFGWIQFRFNSFFEFFLAKYIREDKIFYIKATSRDHYLQYAHSLDYLTGLQRNNLDILMILKDLVTEKLMARIQKNGIKEIELSFYDDIRFEKDLIDTTENVDKEDFLENLRRKRITEELKDEIYDSVNIDLSDSIEELSPDSEPLRRKTDDADYQFIETLTLYANVIKNCELIQDKESKKINLRNCVENSLKYIFLLLLEYENLIDNMDDDDLLAYHEKSKSFFVHDQAEEKEEKDIELTPDELRLSMKIFSKPLFLLLFETILQDELGSPKLKLILEEELENPELPIVVRVFYTLLYADLRFADFVDKLEKTTKIIINHKYYRHIMFRKLSMLYANSNINRVEQSRIGNLLADLVLIEDGQAGGRKYKKSTKASVIQSISKKRKPH